MICVQRATNSAGSLSGVIKASKDHNPYLAHHSQAYEADGRLCTVIRHAAENEITLENRPSEQIRVTFWLTTQLGAGELQK